MRYRGDGKANGKRNDRHTWPPCRQLQLGKREKPPGANAKRVQNLEFRPLIFARGASTIFPSPYIDIRSVHRPKDTVLKGGVAFSAPAAWASLVDVVNYSRGLPCGESLNLSSFPPKQSMQSWLKRPESFDRGSSRDSVWSNISTPKTQCARRLSTPRWCILSVLKRPKARQGNHITFEVRH
ncbi:hypothetical protein H100_07085 [Trichophyton rubrum MR850]|nr:hypothetical protein H100_07085 [Trichophyton rubrum MR850]